MKRRHQVVLFAVLLLSLTILSPSFDFRGSQLNQERDQEKDTFPGSSSRNEDAQAPLEIVVAMSDEEFQAFQKIAKEVAASQLVEINLRNEKPDTYKRILDLEFSLGENGDVVLLDSEEVQYYAQKGYLYPLNGTTLSKSLGDTVVGLRGMTEWNGYQWGMPFDFDPYILAAQSSFLKRADMESLPHNKDQWVKLTHHAIAEGIPLITMNINDMYGTSAWLNHLEPRMAPDQVNRTQIDSQTGDLQQGIQLMNQIQPYIIAQSTSSMFSPTADDNGTPMVVSSLSQLLSAEQASTVDNDSLERLSLETLESVMSRSLVITAGSVEAEEASRWIEGMTSATTQLKWYQQSNQLPAKQKELDMESEKLAERYDMTKGQSWFSTEDVPTAPAERHAVITHFHKKVQQFLKGEITANQYVDSIRSTN
ncbi:extracellular solute-binding protein [Paenibacillus sp. LS1]|uniref:extracellular solute-binding protein n=1 Tax=Paenibacillus sp. LS1 TaxID=2992120 RepID=UPI0022329551|nr:extracellular solute-binding protein [Paenibacillus sp. LS1]MCW3791304.1 extracellular solute-binding protein [Paenibacillus sp. LS1]